MPHTGAWRRVAWGVLALAGPLGSFSGARLVAGFVAPPVWSSMELTFRLRLDGTASTPGGSTTVSVTVLPGPEPPEPLQVRSAAWVVDSGSCRISVLDLDAAAPVLAFSVDPEPSAIALTSDGRRAYVTHHHLGRMSVIDTRTQVVDEIRLPDQEAVRDVVLSPDERYAYVAAGHFVAIDTSSHEVVAAVDVGAIGGLSAVAVTPDGSVVLTAGAGSLVQLIDAASFEVRTVLDAGAFVSDVAVSPEGSFAYAVHEFNASITVIDLSKRTIENTFPLAGSPGRIAFHPTRQIAYVPAARYNFAAPGMVAIVDTSLHAQVATLPMPWYPQEAAVAPEGDFVYVTDLEGAVVVVDATSNTLYGTIPLEPNPRRIAISSAR